MVTLQPSVISNATEYAPARSRRARWGKWLMAKRQVSLIPAERIERSILLIRGQKVLLDSDLASLYGVTTKRLNEQVKRNIERFPMDFMFQLNAEEHEALRSQIATLKTGRGGHPPQHPWLLPSQWRFQAELGLSHTRRAA